MATRTQNVLGERGRRIRELTALVQKRFGFGQGQVELYAEKVISFLGFMFRFTFLGF
jgi:small subunit ribosomal protein S3e